jgi:ABC-type branched-subunit amino acid transport system substrate-binding protein
MKLAKIGVLGISAVMMFAACSSTPGASGGGGGGKTLTIGTELPMSGGETANGVPTANGVKLAVQQANAANTIPGYTLAVNSQDDALNGVHDPATGGKNMTTLVNDATVVGVVGPFNSGVAQVEIPISNAAGLLQCSPANTNTGLTYPPDALQYRKTNPDKINYVRLAAPDSIQGPAGADYVYNDLGAHSVYILDDTETFGKGVGDSFQAEFVKDGGTVAGIHDIPDAAKFNTDYKAAFGSDPGAYSAIAYACAQVIIAGAKAAIAAGKTANADIREAVRAGATAAGNKFTTIIGDVSFDANGDTTAPYMSFYKVDMTADSGKGAWVWVKQQAFTDPNANAAPAAS